MVYGDNKVSNAKIYDILLHSRDRAYTVPELYEWLDGCELNLIDFAENKTLYFPERYIENPELLQKISALPLCKRQAIAELIGGTLKKHAFYVSVNTDTVAELNDLVNIPFFFRHFSHDHFYGVIKDLQQGKTMAIDFRNGEVVNIPIGKYTKYIFTYMDGNRCLRAILELIKSEEQLDQSGISDEEIFDDFRVIYSTFNGVMDIMALRDKSVSPFKSYRQMQRRLRDNCQRSMRV